MSQFVSGLFFKDLKCAQHHLGLATKLRQLGPTNRIFHDLDFKLSKFERQFWSKFESDDKNGIHIKVQCQIQFKSTNF